jgi:hypothetical protein
MRQPVYTNRRLCGAASDPDGAICECRRTGHSAAGSPAAGAAACPNRHSRPAGTASSFGGHYVGPGQSEVRGGQPGAAVRPVERGRDEGGGDHGLSAAESPVLHDGGWVTDRSQRGLLAAGLRAPSPSPTSAICMSATTSGNCACRARRRARRLPPRNTRTLTRNMLFTLRSAFVQTLEAKAVLDWRRPTSSTTTRSSTSARRRLQGRRPGADRPGPHRVAARAVRIGDPDRNRQSANSEDRAVATAGRPHAGGPVRRSWAVRLLQRPEAADDFEQAALDARPDLPGALSRGLSKRRPTTSWRSPMAPLIPPIGAWYTWNPSFNNPNARTCRRWA